MPAACRMRPTSWSKWTARGSGSATGCFSKTPTFHPRWPRRLASAAADLVDVVDLPGRVVEERHGRRLHEEIMVIGGAAQERSEAGDRVAHLEADAVDEEPLARSQFGRAQHDVAALPRPDRAVAQHRVGAPGRAIRPPRRIGQERGGARLADTLGDAHRDADPGAGVDGRERGRRPLDRDAEAGKAAGDPTQVVGVVDTDAELEQAAARRRHELQLLAAVDGGVAAFARRRETELLVVRGGPRHVGDADGDRGETMQGHGDLLSGRRDAAVAQGADALDVARDDVARAEEGGGRETMN